MKVILLENIRKVGAIGEIIDVKRGFARNFLISKKKALFASKENVQQVQKIKNDLNKKDQDKKKEAKKIGDLILNKEFEIKKLSTENKELYGSVKPTEISKILYEKEKIEIRYLVINRKSLAHPPLTPPHPQHKHRSPIPPHYAPYLPSALSLSTFCHYIDPTANK